MKIKNPLEKLITLASALILVVGMYLLKISCFFKLIFKISCPGCGITRACISALKLDFAAAFDLNPMFWSVPILVLLYLFDGRLFKYKWLNYLITGSILAGFIVCWVIRLINGEYVI